MVNLSYVIFTLFIISLSLMLPVLEKKARLVVGFMIVGIVLCLAVSEINGMILRALHNDVYYVTTTLTPVTEEIFKALPVLYFAFFFSDDKKTLVMISFAVGVGFALMENTVILTQNLDNVTIYWALVRGFGSGLVHGICTVTVGYGISFVHKHRILFSCGTFALLSTAIIYHATYNTLVQSRFIDFGLLLPILTYIPFFIFLPRGKKITDKKRNRSAFGN